MHFHGLEEASMGQRVLVSLEGDTRIIIAPASQAVLLLRQNQHD